MRRFGPGAFGALAAATVAAFFVTQHIKLADPLISGYPHPSPAAIAPARRGCYRLTRLSFYLQHRADDVTVQIVDPTARVVRTVAAHRHMARNVRSLYTWDGRDERGMIVPDGTYFWRAVLLGQHRTLQIPEPPQPVIVRDTPLLPRVVSISPQTISQPGTTGATIRFAGVPPGASVTVQIYRVGPHGALQLALAFLPSEPARAVWDGRIHSRRAPAGTYLVGLTATDPACSAGRPAPAAAPVLGSGQAAASVTVPPPAAR